MTQVNQIPRRMFPELGTEFNQHYQQMVDGLNTLLGYNGTATLKSSLDLSGNTITGVGAAASESDVVTLGTANSKYSAAALRPQLEANGSNPLQSVRRLNDAGQREQNSSYMNSLLSTAPSANNIQVLFSSPGGGMTTITVPASVFHYADGSSRHLNAFSLTVSNPATYTIAAAPTGAVANGTAITITTTSPISGIAPGSYVTIAGVTNSDFDGFVQIATVGASSFTFPSTLAATTSGGGTVATAGVYYIYIEQNNPNPQYIGVPEAADTPFNRLPSSTDQRQLIAIATIDSSGGVSAQSAGGGTPGSTLNAGSFF